MSTDVDVSESSPLLADSHAASSDRAALSRDDSIQDPPNEEDVTTLRIIRFMCGIWLGSFLAALDSTIIATLSASISASFNSLSMLSWLASAYLIANAAIQPISGRLTDILSRKTGLMFCTVSFALGNLICGLARAQWMMILGRVVAGIGGGGVNAISTIFASDIIPLRRRGLWQGIGNIIFGIGASLGAVVGGLINDVWGWRVAFLMIVPFSILSSILIFLTLPKPVSNSEATWKRIDFLGAFTLITTLILLLLALNSGGNIVPWTHPLVLISLPLSLLFFAIFIYVERYYAAEPIIPLHLILDRTVFAACMTNWFGSMTYFAILFYGPIYFQVKGLSATQAGLHLVPISVGVLLGSIITGLIMRQTGRYYYLSICIQTLLVVSFIIASTFSLSSGAWKSGISFLLCGMGYSGMLTVTLLALISAVDQQFQSLVTSASYAFRSTGSTLGITIASAVFQNILNLKLWDLLGDRPGAAEIISRLENNLEEIEKLPQGLERLVRGAYMDALSGVFLTTLGLSVLGLLVSLAMRENVLHSTLARR
ncbi:hypothetical protein MMC31_007672 [Peltigera leucophlebia]|nr:hypothetical protein [Peltigera leucophlebia]